MWLWLLKDTLFNILLDLMGAPVSFINDTDDIHLATMPDRSGKGIIGNMQVMLDCWGGILQINRGGVGPQENILVCY
jgi:hypothetical protein